MALRASLYGAVDHDLALRLNDVKDFIVMETRVDPGNLLEELHEEAMMGLGGGNVELWDGAGKLLFRSARLRPGQLGGQPVKKTSAISFDTVGGGLTAYRVASFGVEVNGKSYAARTAEPIREFAEAMERFDSFLLFGLPILLVLACGGGYALSSRALAPVDQITGEAQSIRIENLSTRLRVPSADDELRRLVLTLNSMLARLEGSVERMVQFTGDASHELRTPLTLIRAAAEFSLRGDRSREELLEGLQRILQESERTAHLLDDLLLLARADETPMRPVDLGDAVRGAADQIWHAAELKGIELSLDVPADTATVNGDEDSLVRLFVILLDNAVKYSEPARRVAVSLHGLEVSVTDNGPGISGADQAKIWDRFWRADKVRSRNAGGVGLGLAIARSIAERHGAVVGVESELGAGSRFWVRFPALS